ncbi:NAD-dependent epimerase/dehydratase family protein [Aquipuribacter sp. SD81]|uniref:NAD-dependent epimerase/dehydratase family protein n=1 Tax=Aquipuribacter sp. SD81 TaxID=3127703 RepID=UPI00301764FA
MSAPLTWVVGAGGLLGSSVLAAASARGPVWWPREPVPWGTPGCADALAAQAAAFARAAAGAPWRVAWCAGTAVPGSPEEQLHEEEAVAARLLEALARVPGAGAVFLASSGGGVYAGSSGPPFTERTEPRPLAPYGRSKLRLEALAERWAARTGHPVTLGRLSNLYGAGQDLDKPQGLVSVLCRATLLRRPVPLYVSLDTVRDYLWADDAGRTVVAALDADAGAAGRAVVRVMSSDRPTTVGLLLRVLERVAGRRPQVVHATSPAARWQTRDLRLRSVLAGGLDLAPPTPLPVGVLRVYQHLLRLQQQSRLA